MILFKHILISHMPLSSIYMHIYTYIAKLHYELRSTVMCYPKIKPNSSVLGFCYILCCAWYDVSILNYIYIYVIYVFTYVNY